MKINQPLFFKILGYALLLVCSPKLTVGQDPDNSLELNELDYFETRGLKLGHGVWDLLYDKTPDA